MANQIKYLLSYNKQPAHWKLKLLLHSPNCVHIYLAVFRAVQQKNILHWWSHTKYWLAALYPLIRIFFCIAFCIVFLLTIMTAHWYLSTYFKTYNNTNIPVVHIQNAWYYNGNYPLQYVFNSNNTCLFCFYLFIYLFLATAMLKECDSIP